MQDLEQVAPATGARQPAPPLLSLLAMGAVLVFALLLPTSRSLLLWGGAALSDVLLPTLLIGLLLTVPGLALLRLLAPALAWAPLPRLALASAISVALPPLLLLLCEQIGMGWNSALVWLYLLLSAGVLLYPTHPDGRWYRQRGAGMRPVWHGLRLTAADGVLLLLVGLALLVRLYVVRDLPTGLFGDSVHHTLIAQLLVEQGGLFQSWHPYAPLLTMTYHFGLHANVAFAHWLTGIATPQALLITGQILNTIVVVGLVALIAALGGTLRAGIWAVLLAGFVTTIPAHYVVWGRYTQLAGQIVLIAAVVSWMLLAQRTRHDAAHLTRQGWRGAAGLVLAAWREVLLAALLSAAMVLTHYRVTIFAALLIGSYLLAVVLVERSPRLLGLLAARATVGGLIALLIALPWLLNIFQKGYLLRNTLAFVGGYVGAERVELAVSVPAIDPLYLPRAVVALAVLGLLIALWQRAWQWSLLAVWAVLIVMGMVPRAVGLPGTGALDGLTSFGTLFIVLVPLAAYALEQVQQGGQWLIQHWLGTGRAQQIGTGIAGLALLAGLAWGLPRQAQIIERGAATYGDPQLVTAADMQAMDWIRTNTPADARFLVNSFPAYGGTMLAGSDAGWWLPQLTARQSSLPPITYGSEASDPPDFLQQVNALAVSLRGAPLTDAAPRQIDVTTPEKVALLHAHGITHVYSGATSVPVATAIDRLDTAALQRSPNFEQVYAQGGVQIFRLRPTTHGATAP